MTGLNFPCLLSTSIKEVNAVPPTIHSATGAAKFPTDDISPVFPLWRRAPAPYPKA
uniref:Pyrophosphatefructose 6-phosphate 1-phosphotransferase subunit beta-like n=1 Tax=Rhizophora mucronata TaxID=61149 RepID=A0A2P2N1A7_RHIMU